MDAKQWDSQPWWAQRIYSEGLMVETPWIYRVTQLNGIDDPFGPDKEVFQDMVGVELSEGQASLSDLVDMGFTQARKV